MKILTMNVTTMVRVKLRDETLKPQEIAEGLRHHFKDEEGKVEIEKILGLLSYIKQEVLNEIK